ncbi:hypothetical protein IU448_02795 [Nocardia flavorosea]|uniref:acyl-CoA dehydrogenase family protein n=1 Tax=Nocardia flavorosea TaxID=53429 RepID=UPI00189330B0|nr:acyl-CoA dehydrogenase family protein [Nocardia flavorosea]MBF6347940.1 hypothetical protein [Nocardia flavorosea]
MELIWGEDYDVLAEVARSVFQRLSPLTDRDRTVDFSDQVRQFAQLDWLTLGDPRGGATGTTGLASAAAVFVESGRALVRSPLPALTTARDAAVLCSSPTSDELAAAVGAGDTTMVPAFHDPAWGQPMPTLRGGVLNGTVLAVPYADVADLLLVEATADAHGGHREKVLLAVPRTPAVAVEPMPNLGEHSIFAVTFSATPASDAVVLARGGTAHTAVDTARARASVLVAAQVHGAGLALLDRTVRYAQQRRQFGGPIGRFQAVQYLCTDIAVGVHLTSAFVRDAARLLDGGAEAALEVALMRKQARQTAEEMVHAAHEVHAGIGFMVESDVHLFTKTAAKWMFDLGGDHRDDKVILAGLWREQIGGQR